MARRTAVKKVCPLLCVLRFIPAYAQDLPAQNPTSIKHRSCVYFERLALEVIKATWVGQVEVKVLLRPSPAMRSYRFLIVPPGRRRPPIQR